MAPEGSSQRSHEQRPLRVGVIGTGALGRHHARIVGELDGVEMIGIFDRDTDTRQRVADEHGVRAWGSVAELGGEVEAMVVATPTTTHAEIAGQLLEQGVHVMVEKPISSSLEEADQMIAAARSADRILAVGHVEFYNPAVQALLAKDLKIQFAQFERLAAFSPRSLDIDVVLDLMIHDLQVLHALDGSAVQEIRATGVEVLTRRVDMATIRLELASGCVAALTASRVSSERLRKCRLFLPSRYYSLDYQKQSVKGFRLVEREGDRDIQPERLEVETVEPLRRELECFVAACRGSEGPLVTGESGRRALETALSVLEAIAA